MPDPTSIKAEDGSTADVIAYPDAGALVVGASDFIAREAASAIAERGRFSIALSGGGTPKPVYERLATLAGIDWRRVYVLFGDERCVPPADPRSNFAMAKAALIDPIPIPAENVRRMRGEDPPRSAADAYARELRTLLGGSGRVDLVLLGLGDNGHTASIFPGLPAVDEATRTVVAQYVEVVGMWRLTMTPPAINAARRVAFLVGGEGKAEVLQRVLEGPIDPVVLPAQAVRPTQTNALWLVDAPAASKLSKPR